MTAFDAECPRCAKIGKPVIKPQVLTTPNEEPPIAPGSADQVRQAKLADVLVPVTPKRVQLSPVRLFLCVIGFLIIFSIIIDIVDRGSPAPTRAISSITLASQADTDCRQGLDTNCDEDIRELRSQGQEEDARMAEAARTTEHFLEGRRQ